MASDLSDYSEGQPGVLDATIDLTHEMPLVTTGFHPFADFASFREEEARMIRDGGSAMGLFTGALTDSIAGYLTPRLAAAGIGGGVSRQAVAGWLALSSSGPYDNEFATTLRGLTHLRRGVTFPGVSSPMPPQMIVAAMAWVQGQILLALGNLTDTTTLSGLGGIWMDQLLLQLGIILEPVLSEQGAERALAVGRSPHPYADLAGFGPEEGRILDETAAVLAPAASGIGSLAEMYLLSRKESAPYVSTWRGGVPALGQLDPALPAQLSIAVTGWAEMRLMTALNAIAFDLDATGPPAHHEPAEGGELGDPSMLAKVGRVWMAKLTLKLGAHLDPALAN